MCRNNETVWRQELFVRMVEDPDSAFADELGVEDLGHQNVGPIDSEWPEELAF